MRNETYETKGKRWDDENTLFEDLRTQERQIKCLDAITHPLKQGLKQQ